MVCNHSIRLKVSSDEDFVPVLTKSLVDLALTLDSSSAVVANAQKEASLFFEQDLAEWNESDYYLNVEVENRELVISAEGADKRLLAKRAISLA